MKKRIVSLLLTLVMIAALAPAVAYDASAAAQSGRDGITAFVTRLYDVCLSRDPDAYGLGEWVQRLESGAVSGAEAAQGFMFSQEMADKRLSNADFVEILYNAILGRPSEPYGKSAWISRIEGGSSWHSIFIGFAESAEFNGICASYGINVGDVRNIKEIKMPEPNSEPIPAQPITYSGNGDSVVNGVNLPKGNYYVSLKHEGNSNFIVRFYYGSGAYDYMLLANEIGVYSGECLLDDTLGLSVSGGSLEVKADGDWTVTFSEVAGTEALPLRGTGDTVTGLVGNLSGRRTVTLTHNGSSNFIVRVYTYDGGRRDYSLLSNEIGAYSGETLCSFTAGKQYFFHVQADGDWSISIS